MPRCRPERGRRRSGLLWPPAKTTCAAFGQKWRIYWQIRGSLLAAPPGILRIRLTLSIVLLLTIPSMAAARSSRDASTLASRGAAAIEDRRFGDALAAFSEAAAARPGDASVAFGAGVAAFMLGRNDDARAWFERALERSPAYVPPAAWLGELHYRAGRIQEAIATYETALTRSPHAREVEQRLAEWRREANLEQRFSQAQSAHFLVQVRRLGRRSARASGRRSSRSRLCPRG